MTIGKMSDSLPGRTDSRTRRTIRCFITHCQAGPFDGFDRLAGFIDETDDVPAAHVERDVIAQPAVLALDHAGAVHDAEVGDRAQGNLNCVR